MPALLRNGTFALAITFTLTMGLQTSSIHSTDGTWDLDVAASKFDRGRKVRRALTKLTERPSR
jgi:hypothetical protein